MQESLFSNVAGLKACNFVKNRLQYSCFRRKFSKFSKTPSAAASEFCSDGYVRIVGVSK